ncbi:MAG: hypothetical protein ACRYGK_06060, partial [Janthinobacterium lividum]
MPLGGIPSRPAPPGHREHPAQTRYAAGRRSLAVLPTPQPWRHFRHSSPPFDAPYFTSHGSGSSREVIETLADG